MDPISTVVTIFEGYKNIKIASEITQKAFKVLQPMFAHFEKENREKILYDPYFQHTIDVVQQAMNDLENEGIDVERITDTNPEVIIEILEEAKNESSNELQDLWAKLLTLAILDKGRNFRKELIKIAKNLDPLDAIYLKSHYETYLKLINNNYKKEFLLRNRNDTSLTMLSLNSIFLDLLKKYLINLNMSLVIEKKLLESDLIEEIRQSSENYLYSYIKNNRGNYYTTVDYTKYVLSPIGLLFMKSVSTPSQYQAEPEQNWSPD